MEHFADAVGQCILAGDARGRSVGRGVNKVVGKRKAVSGGKVLSPVANAGIPGEKGGLIKRTRRRFESKTSIAVRSPYVSALEFGRENDDNGGKRSRRRFGANEALSGGMGNHKANLLSREEGTVILLSDC